jgi:hypothetical protein
MSFNTLDRELSIRTNDLNNDVSRSMSIQSNRIESNQMQTNRIQSNRIPTKRIIQKQKINLKKVPITRSMSAGSTVSKVSKVSKMSKVSNETHLDVPDRPKPSDDNINKKIKYVTTNKNNFRDFYLFGNRLGKNNNTDIDNELRYSESTRRKTLSPSRISKYKQSKRDDILDSHLLVDETDEIDIEEFESIQMERMNIYDTGDNMLSINSNEVPMSETTITAAKVGKASEEYWDNTKRRNLNTSTYTKNPNKTRGRGFGKISSYDIFANGVGVTTRNDDPDTKPRNMEDDRIFMMTNNYNYNKHNSTKILPCGADTRHLNKKIN